MAGQRLRGVGVDCVNFAVAVLDELAGTAPTPLTRKLQDSGLHASWAGAAGQTLLEVARVHDLRRVEPDAQGELELQPGDTVVHRLGKCGGAGHLSVVAWKPAATYQAVVGKGVCLRPLPLPEEVVHVWRVSDRSVWSDRLRKGP